MEENEKKVEKIQNFTTVKNPNNFKSSNTKTKSGFGKSVLLPFFSGVVGCAVVLGTCLESLQFVLKF